MNFFNFSNFGLFYGGLAAISAPIIIHFLNRQRYKRIRWAAMEFLLLAFKRTRRRVQVEHLIILLIRCLMLLMLGAALARPLGALVTGGRDVYVLVDDSYSMEYVSKDNNSAWDRAKVRYKYIVEGLSPGDRLHVVFLSDEQKNLLRAKTPGAEMIPPRYAIERLEDLKRNNIIKDIVNPDKTHVSDFPTNIHAGLKAISKLMFDSQSEKAIPLKEFYVISDFQKYAWLPAGRAIGDDPIKRHGLDKDIADMKSVLNDIGRPRSDGTDVKIFLMDVGDQQAMEQHRDIVIEQVSADRKELVEEAKPTFNIKLRNLSKKDGSCKVGVKVFRANNSVTGVEVMNVLLTDPVVFELDQEEIEIAVPMETAFARGAKGSYWAEVSVRGNNDKLEANSNAYYAFRVKKGVKVLVIDGDRNDLRAVDSETYSLQFMLHPNLERAGAGSERYFRTYMAPPVVTNKLPRAGETGEYSYDKFDMVIMANVNLNGYESDDRAALENYVKAGGHLMVFMGDNVAEPSSMKIYNSLDIMPLRLDAALGDIFSDKSEVHGIYKPEHIQHAIFSKIITSKRLEEHTKGSPAFSKYFAAELRDNSEIITYLNANDERDEKRITQIPFMAVRSCGERGLGKTIMFNTTCDNAWGNLTKTDVDEVFIVMLHETILYLLAMEQWNVTVGDVISRNYQLDANYPTEGNLFVLPPQSDKVLALDSEQLDNNPINQKRWFRCMFSETYAQGRGELRVANAMDVFGVNVALEESDLDYADPEALIVRYDGLKSARILPWDFGTDDGGIVELEGITTSPDSWKLPLLIMVCLMAMESVLALWFGRKSAK